MSAVSTVASRMSKTLTFSREFTDLVRAIGECKSKQEEDVIVKREASLLKSRLSEPKLDRSRIKEYIIRLMYVEMLGHDASFGYVFAVKAAHENNLMAKKVGYLASAIFLDDSDELIFLLINTMQNDLKSDNILVVCAALDTICNLCSEDAVPAVLPLVLKLLGHAKEIVRKKATLALHRMHQKSPYVSDSLNRFRDMLCDKDPSVMSAAICALHDLIAADCEAYKGLTSSFAAILKQVVDGRLPKTYEYHKCPAPFVQIRLLKILALLGANDRQTSSQIFQVLSDTIQAASGCTAIMNSILYECVRTVTSIYPNQHLLALAEDVTSRLLKSSSSNFRYIGVCAMICIIQVDSSFVEQHQMTVIDCLEDPDDSLRKKTLELLEKMTTPENVDVIVDRMLEFLDGVTDEVVRQDIVSRVSTLVERFSPDDAWFLSTMNRVFEVGGDEVDNVLAYNLIHLIAEGGSEGDNKLQRLAVDTYIELLGKAELPAVMLKVICWILGEYGTSSSNLTSGQVLDMLCSIASRKPNDDELLGFVIMAMTKICGQEELRNLTPQAEDVVSKLSRAQSTVLSQMAQELQLFLTIPPATFKSICPARSGYLKSQKPDFTSMDNYVEELIASGAIPRVSEQANMKKEKAIPVNRPVLKVAAYERPEVIDAVPDSFHLEPVDLRDDIPIQSNEPKLIVHPRRRRWGQQEPRIPPNESEIPQSVESVGKSEVRFNQHEVAAQSPEDTRDSGRQQLAASLFRKGGRTQPNPRVEESSGPGASFSNTAQPATQTVDLLDLDTPSDTTVEKPIPDIFSQLESLAIGESSANHAGTERSELSVGEEQPVLSTSNTGVELCDLPSEGGQPSHGPSEALLEDLIALPSVPLPQPSGDLDLPDMFGSLQTPSSGPTYDGNKSWVPNKPGAMRPGAGPQLVEKKDPFKDLLS